MLPKLRDATGELEPIKIPQGSVVALSQYLMVPSGLSRALTVRIFELRFRIADHDAYVWYPGYTDSHKKLAITYEDPLPHEFFSIKCCKARRYPRLQDSSLPLFRTTTYSPLFTGISSLIFRALTIAER